VRPADRTTTPPQERRIAPLDERAMTAARVHLDRLTKPPGSLGRLEEIVVQVAGISGEPRPPLGRRAIVVAAGDHGVTRQGVSAYPSSVTPQMIANFVAGGAAINALASTVGADIVVLDVGVAGRIPRVAPSGRGGRLITRRIADGTADMTEAAAMTPEQAQQAMLAGAAVVDELIEDGLDVLGLGEMGIGNTTAASALVAALTGLPADDVTGPGTGLDDAGRARKVATIEVALRRHHRSIADPLGALAAVGGLEIAALVGAMLAAAAAQVPVVLDGFITGAAALVAARLRPEITARCIASHRSVEPGHAIVLHELGLRPLLDLDLRLGEGTGAALGIGLLASAVAMRDGMATFQGAGVDGPSAG
jgi:nicotinate-nucleotide--dimethylbenzimidazole phosphoribosyltransferase